jgi:hypothetical protein
MTLTFSQRYGYVPVKKILQLEDMDIDLKNGLWNVLTVFCWNHTKLVAGGNNPWHKIFLDRNSQEYILCECIWVHLFKKRLDDFQGMEWNSIKRELKDYFLGCEWHEVYTFLEFVCLNYERSQFKEKFIEACNGILKKESSGYRFINGELTRIIEEHEIASIEEAIQAKSPSARHFEKALRFFSDKQNPDYSNSIKESISAVESCVKSILKREKGTLGELLNELRGLHRGLSEGFKKIYGYTSDADGIRHGIFDKDNSDFFSAKFMLVACSAFVNFLNGQKDLGKFEKKAGN